MSSTLGFLVLGVTLLAQWTHAVPYAIGLADRGLPGGQGGLRHRARSATSLFYVVQLATMLDPLHGRQHQLQRLPLPRQLRGRATASCPAS